MKFHDIKLFRSRDKPRNALNGSGYSFLFGNTVAGKAVNERSAMQMSAVYACVRILSEAINREIHAVSVDHPLGADHSPLAAAAFRETAVFRVIQCGGPAARRLSVAHERLCRG